MKKLTIQFDQPQIEINGVVFDLQKSDGDILQKALDLETKYSTIEGKDSQEILAALKDVVSYIDEILGEGAMKQLSGGRPVGLVKSLDIMKEIALAAYESYNEKIIEEYE